MAGLKDKYKTYFKIGAAVNARTVVTHADLLKQHFNSLTCENEMKYASLCEEPGIYRFEQADKIYDFAKKNGMSVHGHVFVWHQQAPEFLFETTNREQLLTWLHLHLKLLGGRYRDKTESWDVVNEAVEDKRGYLLRDTGWYRGLGETYLEDCFRMAKTLFPEKLLYYNDYNECEPNKREKIIRLLRGLKERDVPIDGVGLQSHHNIYTPELDEVKRSIEAYAALGLKLRISELDVSLFAFDDRSSLVEPEAALLEKQARYYGDLFAIYREYSDLIEAVTLWGIADDATWLDEFPVPGRKNWPLLFDVEHKPKEAYYRVMDF